MSARCDRGLDALQLGGDPAVGGRERHVAVEGAAGLALFLRVRLQAAVVALAVHQHEPRGVPELVAEVPVALAALAVEVDVAPERGERREGEAQRIGAVAGDAVGELLLRRLADLRRDLGAAQALRALDEQGLERDAVDEVHRVEHVALGLAHLLAVRIAHEAVDVHVAEGHLAGEVRRHHDHPGDPEEDDVVAGDEHGGRQEQRELRRLRGPAERGEGHEGRRVPGVEHVLVARERAGIARCGRALAGLLLAARHEELAAVAVPGRDLVAPPELARDAPVLDVAHPLVVRVHPLLGDETHRARLHGVDRLAGDGAAVGARLRHGDEPLVGEHRLDDLPGARAARHHELVLAHLHEQALRLQVGHDTLAGVEAVEPAVGLRRVVVDLRVEREHADHRQAVALADGVVVHVVRRGDLHHAGAELAVDVVVGDHRDRAAGERQVRLLAVEGGVALVLGVHHQGGVAEHGLGPRGGDDHRAGAVDQRVADEPQLAVFLLALHLEVGHGRLEHRIPVDEPLAAVDEALVVQAHERLGDDRREPVVHREVLALPARRSRLRGASAA